MVSETDVKINKRGYKAWNIKVPRGPSRHKEYNKIWKSLNKDKVAGWQKAYQLNNKEKLRAYWNKYHKDRREHFRELDVKRKYGIDAQDYRKLFENQKGKCAICGNEESKGAYVLSVDHDHETKEIRGLLCNDCNRGIGLLGDDVERLKVAVKYLSR